MNEFLDQLNSNQFKEIEKFFETMPKLSYTLKVKNPNTKVDNSIKCLDLINIIIAINT